jgi:outer membrane protein assembly factor BamA
MAPPSPAAPRWLGTRFTTIELTAGWQYDSRNRALFADRGLRSALSFTIVPPGMRRALLHR